MWIRVYRASDGQNITTAKFSVEAYNNNDGWYWMSISAYQTFCVGAPGYNSQCGNTASYSTMYAALTVYAPPPTCGNCWS